MLDDTGIFTSSDGGMTNGLSKSEICKIMCKSKTNHNFYYVRICFIYKA